MINLDEEIERFEKLASDYEFNLDMHQRNVMKLSVNDIERMKRNAQENRQRAEWLRELKAYREAREEIIRKRDSSQWSELVVHGFSHAIYTIDNHLKEVNADDRN